MAYRVKEMFPTLQGEGINAGRAAVFCRFTGCNLWTGREDQRAEAVCRFCDTDFVGTDGPGGGVFDGAAALAAAAAGIWEASAGSPPMRGGPLGPLIVFTGGEPMLQLDPELIGACHDAGFEVAVETNGTIGLPDGIDWVCVSPKAGSEVVVRSGDELKLVYPQPGADPAGFTAEGWDFEHFVLQPMDGPDLRVNTEAAIRYCLANPRWRLGIQTHKVLRIP
ncbi:MAG: 7-carboxy-7-deazaguanine synthase [Actinomycetia bacterium]|nr:7-carboxy-7-deazaguanine synthase [Actinomycetes bacterium]